MVFVFGDTDEDGVLDGCMHVDYDVEFYGVNPLGNLCYLAALRSAEEMARYLGDEEHEKRYHILFESASAKADSMMWNGEYYEQILEDVDQYKYQHGKRNTGRSIDGAVLCSSVGAWISDESGAYKRNG